MNRAIYRLFSLASCVLVFSLGALAQDATKRNDRPPEQPSPTPQHTEEKKQPVDATRYTYEFNQPAFVVSHIVIEHDALGRGNITFVQRTETPIVEPIEISSAAQARIFGLWTDLRFLDSKEDYQAAKNFAHLGTYKIGMNDGKRSRIAEFNWSDNKTAWALAAEYRRVADQAIWVFNIKLAREMQPLNTPGLLTELEGYLTRNEVSDARQLVPLLNELKVDYHIPLIARNHADRLLKKIEK
ncbi:MAG TPA: hypothetical protein VK557_05725 [Pyrinomonadaceae bacterium]|nr:hypothetical protein [Pyrinomonadaceae bacterium]